MSEEKDFFKTCFNTVASLDVKNESQVIAKEVVLSEVENLQQENKQLNEEYTKVQKMYEDTFRDYQKQKEAVDKIYELIKQHIRKDEFLELNEWQTRDLLKLLKEVSDE